jgi:hypothetical protein
VHCEVPCHGATLERSRKRKFPYAGHHISITLLRVVRVEMDPPDAATCHDVNWVGGSENPISNFKCIFLLNRGQFLYLFVYKINADFKL